MKFKSKCLQIGLCHVHKSWLWTLSLKSGISCRCRDMQIGDRRKLSYSKHTVNTILKIDLRLSMKIKVKCSYEVRGPSGRRLSPVFMRHETARSISTPPGLDAGPSQGCPRHWIRGNPFILRGWQRHCESTVTCPTTRNNVPGQGLTDRRMYLQWNPMGLT